MVAFGVITFLEETVKLKEGASCMRKYSDEGVYGGVKT
jgi:hypothetical protein